MNNYELTQEKNNLTEHIRITKQNLQIVNGELTDVLFEKDKVQGELEDARQEIVDTRIKADGILEYATLSANEILSKANLILAQAEQTVTEANQKADEIIGESKFQREELNRSISELTITNSELLTLNKRLNEENPKLLTANKELMVINNKLTEEFNELDIKLDLLKTEIATTQRHSELEKERFNEQVKEIQVLIAAELEKIKHPYESLMRESLEVDKKKKNLNILVSRFKTKYEKVFPNQEIKL